MIAEHEVRARVRDAGGDELCERLDYLEAARGGARRFALPRPPDAPARPDYDVVIAGGGLWLLLAPLLADRGLRVAVFDRARAGSVHREWNAGRRELEALARTGLFTAQEVDDLVVSRYSRGVCRWHGGGEYPVTGVLDLAFDAGRLLREARARAEARGVEIYDGHTMLGHASGPRSVSLLFETAPRAPKREVVARLFVDARGASSPYATADLMCPTVGGVVGGLEEGEGPTRIRPDVGDILATTEGIEEGVQHIWEAFPGRPGEVAVYLFYYARTERVSRGSLWQLYARFFERLPRYKKGAAHLLRPTFGYIPGWSRLSPAPRPPAGPVVLVGDAAARHSPLTFCGFGATLRSLGPSADAILRAVERPTEAANGVMCDAPIHTGTGALARLMASPSLDPRRKDEMNALLDTAFATLHSMGSMGNEAYAALLRDEMSPDDFVRFLRQTAAKRPRVYVDVFGSLGALEVGRWGSGILRELLRARG